MPRNSARPAESRSWRESSRSCWPGDGGEPGMPREPSPQGPGGGFALGIWSPLHRGEAGGGGGGVCVCVEEGVARKVPSPYLKVHPAVAQK